MQIFIIKKVPIIIGIFYVSIILKIIAIIVEIKACEIFCNKNVLYGILKFFKKQYACACMEIPPKDIKKERIGANK